MDRNIRVLLAKLGLDVHNRGIVTVAREIRDAGMEVVYVGNALPHDVIRTAVQEDVQVVGVSSLGGAHLTLGRMLMDAATREGLSDSVGFVIGGVFPPDDIPALKALGFDRVFTPGATKDEIVSAINELVQVKSL